MTLTFTLQRNPLSTAPGKNVQLALSIANELSGDGKYATDIIGLINWQFKRIEAVKHCLEKKSSSQAMAQKLQLSPYVLKLVSKQAANFSSRELAVCFDILLDSDLAIKKGLRSPQLTLETLIVRICKGI